MTGATTRKCSHCGERFSLALRQGRNSRRARAGQERTFQQAQRFCSANCRKAASKARRTRSETPVTGPIYRAPSHLNAPQGTKPLSGVASPSLSVVYGAQKSTRPALQMTFGGYGCPGPGMAGDVPGPQTRWRLDRHGEPDPRP